MKYKPPNAKASVAATFKASQDAYARGRLNDAESLCRYVLELQPDHVEALVWRADISVALGQNELAHQLLRTAVGYAPDHIPTLLRLAEFLLIFHAQEAAAKFAHRAAELAPNDAGVLYAYGRCCLELWRITEAIETLKRAIECDPGFAPAFWQLGYALRLAGHDAESIATYRHAIELDRNIVNCYVELGLLLERHGDSDAADATFAEVHRRAAGSVDRLIELAEAYKQASAPERGELALRSALALDPKAYAPQLLLGELLQDSGRFEEALVVFREALALHPEESTLYYDLAYNAKVTEADRPMIESMAILLERQAHDPRIAAQLNYGIGKAFDDLGEYCAAMKHFHAANQIQRLQMTEAQKDRNARTASTDTLASTFTPEFFLANRGLGSDSVEPVFIIGMPRSGTTLTEQLLSRHPSVGAVGELNILLIMAPSVIKVSAPPAPEKVRELAETYLRVVRASTHGHTRIVDKMNYNFMLAGLIHLVFPDARIIHCRRNPIDTCLSIYVTPISVDFSHSLSDIAFAYKEYLRLMEHWRKVLPADRFFEFDYEALVANPKPVAQQMIDFIGLNWNDAVLQHKSKGGAVNTASRWQVRQPINTGSVDRWRRYAPWIGELLDEFSETTCDGPYLL